MKLSEKIQEALREQQEINLSNPAGQKRLAAQWGYVPAGAQPAPTEMSITTWALSEMFLSLDGHDKAQPGYEWRKGWNDAIRQAMDYAQPAPSVPREAIEKMLTQLMDIAVSNGANSISMPDEYVEVAAWLCGIPAQPAPSIHEVTDAMALAFHSALTDGSIGEHEMEEIKAGLRAALAAAPEAKP